MTKRIRIDGKTYNREELVFLAGGRIEWADYLDRARKPEHYSDVSLNEREDGSLMPWEDVPDSALSRNEENAKMDPAILKVTNAIEAAGREVDFLASILRLAGVQGAKDAPSFARAAAENMRKMGDRILVAGGADSGVRLVPLY